MSGDAGDPLGDPTVALRGSHYLGPGPPMRNHVEHRVVPYQAVPARRIGTPPASQAQADPERATVHPLRRDAPVTSRCTRSERV